MSWKVGNAANLERFAIESGEFVHVRAGFVMVVNAPALRVDGMLRLSGVVRIGG